MGLFGLRSREERFWKWFEENSDRIRHFESDQDTVLGELSKALKRVDGGLMFELGPDESPREFVISADGVEAHFPAAIKLVEAAPALDDWLVVAFRQPGPPDATIEFLDRTLGPEDIWFTASQGGGRSSLVLYVRDIDEESFDALAGAVFLLMDNLLGEHCVVTRVGEIDWDRLPDDPAAAGLLPFIELRGVFGVAEGPGKRG